MSASGRISRIGRLIALLRQLEAGPLNADAFAEATGVSRRTVFRDLATLRSAGVLSETTPGDGPAKAPKDRTDSSESEIGSLLARIQSDLAELKHMVKSGEAASPDGSSVFVVHGHNEGKREAVARLLEKLGLNPIVLHEQPNKGRTILEKFLGHADVPFAVVLLTGDDLGKAKSSKKGRPAPRARQNVVLELGFFLGKLGRERVCALYEEGVEIPSDYQGVVFVPLDSEGAWKIRLAVELREAGLPIQGADGLSL